MDVKPVLIPEFLSGGGETGEMIRTRNWAATPLGPPEHWPQSLKTCVRIVLTSQQPMFVWWGNDLINIYNDAYREILGGKHPQALGKPAHEVWKEIWNEVGPRAEIVMKQNTGTYDEALLLIMERNGYPEETYYTFSYSPIPGDEGGVGGIICANTNNTDLVINERSIETLRGLAALTYNGQSIEEVYQNAADILNHNRKDFPLALFYQVDEKNRTATAIAWAGDKEGYTGFPAAADLSNPTDDTRNLYAAVEHNQLTLVPNNGRRTSIPTGFWDIVPSQFLHIPINRPNNSSPLAVLTIGLNPYRQFNDTYRNFIKLVADQISRVINNVLAYEEERRRAEALEEIDRAKTHFFSNISHEFRTPLTLILGPLENTLKTQSGLPEAVEQNLNSVHRNSLRLLRLVNMLLEFSRIEAGRIQARYQPLRIDEFTRDLASSFRSTLEHAGLNYTLALKPIKDEVYVDREMWEKIVLNLLSNAFKYTLKGEIRVSLQQEGKDCVLSVTDTGIGIPAEELPHMFERFHRVQNSEGRSYEGTGIGLSLVYELVKLHGGTIGVESVKGEGSTFTVKIPTGKAHLDAKSIIDRQDDYVTSNLLDSLVGDAQQADKKQEHIAANESTRKKAKVLVVDDNADMRDYIRNLLWEEYDVQVAVNGADALEKVAKDPPTVLLSDIMMPVMDGNELLHKIKSTLETAHIPVIFLSARAGDEAKAEGLQAGADDYLVKPFSAREVQARVRTQVKLAQTRSHLSEQLKNLFSQAPIAMCIFKGKDMRIDVANERMLELWGKTADVIGKTVLQALPEIKGQGFDLLLDQVFETGERFVSEESAAILVRKGREEHIFVKFVFEALRDESGEIIGVMAMADEVTHQVLTRKTLEASEKRYKHLISNLPVAMYTCDMEGYITLYNQAAVKLWGREPVLYKDKWHSMARIFKADGVTPVPLSESPMAKVLKQETVTEKEVMVEKENGERIYVQVNPIPMYNDAGRVIGAISMLSDVTEQKNAQRKIEENQLLFETISNSAPVGLWITDTTGHCTFVNATWLHWTGKTLKESLEKGWFTEILEEDQQEITEGFGAALKRRAYFKGEFRLKRSDGQLRWCLTEGYPFKNAKGEFVGYAGSVTDITDKKNAQEELEKTIEQRTRSLQQSNDQLKSSEEKYHRMTEEIQDYAIILLDKEGTILNWNNGARKIKGYTEEEVIGKNFRIFYLPEDIESYLPEKLISLAVDTGRATNEGWRKRKDGTKFWGSIVITALHGKNNEIIGFSKITRDLTERKLAEDTMRKYLIELEKRNSELEQFAYVSSHDLQEPLRKIRTFADLLENQMQESDEKNYLRKIHHSAERMSNLIKDLLNYSRLSKENAEFVDVDLNKILENVKLDLELVIEQKKATIHSDQLPVIKGIALQFNQLFLNLVSNSLKFNTGLPEVTISARPAHIYEVVAEKLDPKWSYTRLVFADNGIGFEPHYSEQIFTIFQRLNTRQKFSGTGIGLAMCKKIVDNHNGYIKAFGMPNEGATFVIYLPNRT